MLRLPADGHHPATPSGGGEYDFCLSESTKGRSHRLRPRDMVGCVSPIRTVIVDDETLVRRALASFLSPVPDIEVVGECTNGREAVERCEEVSPDIVLMDVRMPVMDGIEATARIVAARADTRVIGVTTLGTMSSVIPLLRAGASGYLLKDSEPADIVEAIRSVVSGRTGSLSHAVLQQLVSAAEQSTAPVHSDAGNLSAREIDVVRELSTGKSNTEIGRSLHMSEATVKTHLSRVMTKWDVRDRVQVVISASQRGMIHLGPQRSASRA